MKFPRNERMKESTLEDLFLVVCISVYLCRCTSWPGGTCKHTGEKKKKRLVSLIYARALCTRACACAMVTTVKSVERTAIQRKVNVAKQICCSIDIIFTKGDVTLWKRNSTMSFNHASYRNTSYDIMYVNVGAKRGPLNDLSLKIQEVLSRMKFRASKGKFL